MVCVEVVAPGPNLESGPDQQDTPRWSSLAESKLLRFVVLSALYFAQGVPWGFIGVGYIVYLTDLGFDNTAVGAALGLAYVPWSFKVIWGPLIDRFPSGRFGRRRPFILLAELLMAVTFLALTFVDPRLHIAWVSAILFLHNTFASIQDVATDALAIDVLRPAERGRANSFMWGAKSLGVAAGGGGGMVLAKHLGWPAVFIAIALAVLVVMVLVLAVRERPRGEAPANLAGERFSFRALWHSFAFPSAIAGLAIAASAPIGYYLVAAVQAQQLRRDLHLSEEVIGMLSGVLDPISGVLGALAGGFLADRLGARKAIGGAMVAMALLMGTWALAGEIWAWMPFLTVWMFAVGFSYYAYSAAMLGFLMGLSNPAVGATQFAVFMAAGNLTAAWTAPAGGALTDRYGIPAAFALAAVVQLAAVALLPLCDPRAAEQHYAALAESRSA